MRVRDARPDDWPAVARLLAELGRPVTPGDAQEPAQRAHFETYLADPDVVALVAADKEDVVGFIDMCFIDRPAFLDPMAWIPDLIVAEHRRSEGIGSLLLAGIEERAGERGVCWIQLESATWRTRAHAFYEREGWSEAAKAFVKGAGDQRWMRPPVE